MRLIDADKAISDYAHYGISHSYDAYDLENILTECPTVEAIPKADYENRLKADMAAMLTELKSEIDKMQCLYVDFAHYVNEYDVSNLIQQKINELKAESEDK